MADCAKNELVLAAPGLCLRQTLFCGQSFSWREAAPGRFVGVVGAQGIIARQAGHSICLQKPDGLPFAGEERDFWRRYFSLDVDYEALQAQFAMHPLLAQCVASAPGIRVLRQPFFDTLLSFIISQNNHIPRIFGIVQRLRQAFGTPLPQGEFAFPTPQALAQRQVDDLACLRAGFRAKYLLDAARRVAAGEVGEEKLAALRDDDARRMLCTIAGVGPKVADCVLLFALGRQDVAPMDVWMGRALQTHFGGVFPACAAGARGIAQQYIFHWMRTQAG